VLEGNIGTGDTRYDVFCTSVSPDYAKGWEVNRPQVTGQKEK